MISCLEMTSVEILGPVELVSHLNTKSSRRNSKAKSFNRSRWISATVRIEGCRSAYRVEGLDDLKRHIREVTNSVGCREALKDVSSPGFLLLRSEIGLGLEGVTVSPATSELVACKC